MVLKCEICGVGVLDKSHAAREMMYGLSESFSYGECNACGSLSLLDPPADMARYYPSDYYSFSAPAEPSTFVRRWKGKLRLIPGLYRLSTSVKLRATFQTGLRRKWKILDVGCGSGNLVAYLHSIGCRDVAGLEPYFSGSSDALRIYTCQLGEVVEGDWNLIMLHHTLEHMPQPRGTLKRIHDLLAPKGRCLVRIPVVNWAWRQYGVNWVQLDAPRHLFLYTERALTQLASVSGFKVARIEYDSGPFQFWGSEMYIAGKALCTDWTGEKCKRITEFEKRANELNAQHLGDQAAFFLERI